MKTYYDLTKKERGEYLKEFKKTPVGKEMKMTLNLSFFAFLAFIILESVFVSFGYNEYGNFFDVASWVAIGLSILYEIFIDINFTAWLKNKYDIKRW